VNVLAVLGESHGYSLWKAYKAAYGEVSVRSIYYQLHAGLKTGETRISRVVKEEGDFTWGSSVEKTMYALGSSANPEVDPRVRQLLQAFLRKPNKA
jgi:hypothetical protein